MSEKKLFLLDGHALIYRAHYAFISRPLINSKGINTSAIVGFVRTLWDILQNQKPTHIAVVFDPSTPTFRNEIYEPYKANRDAQPEDITIAMPYVQEIIKAFRIPVVVVDGYEADDVIGTLAKQAEQQSFEVYMVTPDKDFGQLVDDKVFMYKPSRKGNGVEIWGVPEVLENWDIEHVDQVRDILALAGDSSDNIPGVPGVGPKTAAKLIKQYGSVENLLEHVDELKGKLRERIEQYGEQALLSKKLATIITDVPVQFDPEKYKVEPYDRERLTELFRELEFRTLATQILGEQDSDTDMQPAATTVKTTGGPAGVQGTLFGDSPTPTRPPEHSVAEHTIHTVEHQYHIARDEQEHRQLIEKLEGAELFAFDTETTELDPNKAELVGMSFALEAHEAWYVPLPADAQERRTILERFRPVLENAAIGKVGQNIKYDALMLKWEGIELAGTFYDTMIAHYLLEPDLRHNLDYLAETYLKYQPVSIESLIGKKGKKQLSMRQIPVEQVAPYAAEDADITLQLYHLLFPRLKEEGLEELYFRIEEPLIKVLVDMEHAGINLDVDFLKQYSKELAQKMQQIEARIYELAGQRFNIASPKQVGEILFEKLKIPYRWRKTRTGQYSTDEEKLSELAKEHEIARAILDYRQLAKLKSTYVDALPPLVNPRTGRIHSSFNQTVAATGRLSSNNPNLQNIPIRTEEGRQIRRAFIPRDDQHRLLSADYSQIELRLIAAISGDEAMLEDFRKGLDIHRATAARVFDVPYDEVTPEQRRRAKTVNFSIIYGAGATNLSRQLDIKRSEAQQLIEQYFKKYPGLKDYMDRMVAFAREHGYVTTLLGRRRYLRDINSRNSLARSNAERMAINTPIQGTAADMIKLAMIQIHQALRQMQARTAMVLQVHDELVFDVPLDELDAVRDMVVDKMKNALPDLPVPIVVEAGVGRNWLEAH